MSYFNDGSADLFGFHYGHTVSLDNNHSPLGQELLMNDAGALSPLHATSSSTSGSTSTTASGSAPAPTLVSQSGSNLAIDLVWDGSVAGAPEGFTSAVAAAAQTFVNEFTTAAKTVLYMAVGWGEVGGQSMSANALGESESVGYLTNYATVAHALGNHGDTLNAGNEPTSGQFFVDSAEAKALGLISGTSGSASAVDGYIGFSTLGGTGYGWNFGATGTASNQYNLQSVVDHEISEVMGRTLIQGTAVYNGKQTFSPLDLFDYSSNHVLSLSNNGGYFSSNGGATQMGWFNNAAAYGGDIGDWQSYASASQSGTAPSGAQDAFDAFTRPGYNAFLSADDVIETAALGYSLTAAGSAAA